MIVCAGPWRIEDSADGILRDAHASKIAKHGAAQVWPVHGESAAVVNY